MVARRNQAMQCSCDTLGGSLVSFGRRCLIRWFFSSSDRLSGFLRTLEGLGIFSNSRKGLVVIVAAFELSQAPPASHLVLRNSRQKKTKVEQADFLNKRLLWEVLA